MQPRAETAEEKRRRHDIKKARVNAYRKTLIERQNASGAAPGAAAPAALDPFKLLVSSEYELALPELPIDARAMALPLDVEEMQLGYDPVHGNSAELGILHTPHAQPSLGLRISLMALDAVTRPASGKPLPLEEEDAYLTRPEFAKPVTRKAEAKPAAAAVDASGASAVGRATKESEPKEAEVHEWMIKPNYMHKDLEDAVYKFADPTTTEAQANKRRLDAMRARYAGPRAERITEGFDAAAAAPVHPLNARLRPIRVWAVMPDAVRGAQTLLHVTFDGDPLAEHAAAGASGGGEGAGASAAGASRRAQKRARLTGAVLRTAAQDMPPSAGARVDRGAVTVDLFVPAAPSGGGEGEGEGGEGGEGDAPELRHTRGYHMLLERPNASAGAGAGAGAGSAHTEEQLALFWDDAGGAVTYAPIRSRAGLTAAAHAARRGGGAAALTVLTRPPLEDELDASEALTADLNETDGRARAAAKAELRGRRALRKVEREAAAARSARAAAEALAKPAGPPALTVYGRTLATREDAGDDFLVQQDEESDA